MSAGALEPAGADEMLFPEVVFGANYLHLPDSMPFEQWQQMGDVLLRVGSGYQWWFGRWLNEGEKRWGEEAQQLADGLGFEYETLNTWRRVDEIIPEEKRLDPARFSYTIHKLAAELPAAKLRWAALKKAEKEGFTTRQMTEYCREVKLKHSGEQLTLDDDAERAKQNTAWERIKVVVDGNDADTLHAIMNEAETLIRERCESEGISQPVIDRADRDS